MVKMRITLDGRIQIQGKITRRLGKGNFPDRKVTHLHKWKTLTVVHGAHCWGKVRELVDKILDLEKVTFRIRRQYYNRIRRGSKVVELRADIEHWRKRLLEKDPPPSIAVFLCGKDVHRRRILEITVEDPEDVLGRELSAQGKKDIPTEKCIAVWLGSTI